MNPIELVDAFLRSYWHQEHERTLALVTEDFLWLNVPLPKLRIDGRAMFGAVLSSPNMGYPEPVEDGHHVPGLAIARGDEVMQERVDRFKIRGAWVENPCNGIWRIRDGKIASWKDYYDIDTYVRQLAAVGVRVDFTEWL